MPPVTFASLRQEQEFGSGYMDPLLRKLLDEFAAYALDIWGWIPCLTSIYRTKAENDAVGSKTAIHCFWRAVDVRTRDVLPETVADVARWLNSRFVYDPRRLALTVAYAGKHGDGPHLHLQVCEQTVAVRGMPPTMESV